MKSDIEYQATLHPIGDETPTIMNGWRKVGASIRGEAPHLYKLVTWERDISVTSNVKGTHHEQ